MSFDTPSHADIKPIVLLCGSVAYFDQSSSCYSYRCEECGAVVGSVGMTRECKELYDMEKVVDKLKGKK